MKKVIIGAGALVLTLVALRRFRPALGKRAMTACQEMMARHQGDAGAELSDPCATLKDAATPAAA